MNLGEIYAAVRTELFRGSRYDAAIKRKVKQAIYQLEKNHKLRGSRQHHVWSVQEGAALTLIRPIDQSIGGVLSSPLIRSVDFLRRPEDPDKINLSSSTTGQNAEEIANWINLGKIAPQDEIRREAGPPTHYWFSTESARTPGADTSLYGVWCYFNTVADRQYVGDCVLYYYSLYDPDDEATTLWILDYGSDAVIAKTMQLLGPTVRDMTLRSRYQPDYDEALRTLLIAEDDMDHDDHVGQMLYTPYPEGC